MGNCEKCCPEGEMAQGFQPRGSKTNHPERTILVNYPPGVQKMAEGVLNNFEISIIMQAMMD